jgi:predicted Zn-dependent protease
MRKPGAMLFSYLLATAAGVGASGTGCTVNPVSRQPEVVLVSEEVEVEKGREGAELVSEQMGLVEDAALGPYVSSVGERLVAQAPKRGFQYRFAIIDQDEPNAFALPGGYIYVSRGLLSIANNEDELAGVIGHEIVHVAARHHAQRQTRAAGVGLLALPGLLAGALIGGPVGDLVSAPFAVAGTGLLAGYSRDQEKEADRIGQEIAARAGYDPRGLADFLVTLERDTGLRVEEPRIPGFFDTHPSTPKRATQAAARAEKLAFEARRPVAGSRDGFLKRLDGVMVGANPAEGVFEGQRFLHPDLRFVVEFPEGWKAVNTRLAVGAIAEGGGAQVVVQHQGSGSDPREASSAFLAEASQHLRVDVARLDREEINGLDAVRGQVVAGDRRGSVSLDLTWIAHRGSIYLITGMVERGYSDAHRATFGRVAHSFRPIRPAERERITETRVRVRGARPGEGLGSLGARTGNTWSVERTAVANALPAGVSLAEGRLVKVALQQRYPGSSR